MSEALCRCGHTTTEHVRVMDPATCTKCNCNHLSTRHDSHTPPPTREPIRLTDEEYDAMPWPYGKDEKDWTPAIIEWAESILAARLAGGPTLADARTPESEDTE